MDGTFSKKLRKTLDLESGCLSKKPEVLQRLNLPIFLTIAGGLGVGQAWIPFFFDCWLDVVLLNFKEVMICWNRNLGNSTLVQSIIYIIHVYIVHQHHKKALHSKQMSLLSGIFLFSHFQLFPSFVTSWSSKSGNQGQWFSQCLGENGGLCWTLSCNGSSHWSTDGVILHNLPACQLDVSYCHSSFDGADCHEGLCSRVYEACLVWTEFFYEKWCWSSSGWKSLNMPVSANQEAEDSCHCPDVLCQRFLCNSLCYISKYHDQGYLGKQPWTQHVWDDNDMTTETNFKYVPRYGPIWVQGLL